MPGAGTGSGSGRQPPGRGEHPPSLGESRHQHDGQPHEQQAHGSCEYPVRQAQLPHEDVYESQYRQGGGGEERRDADGMRLPQRCIDLCRRYRSGRGGRHPAARCRHRLELRQHVVRALPPIGWVLLQAAHDQLAQGGGDGLPVQGHGLRRDVDVGGEHRLRGGGVEGQFAAEHLIRQDADRVQVGPVIDVGIRGRLFGRHVGGRAQGNAERRERGLTARGAHRLSHAEVRDHGVLAGYEHVVRFDVPVHDALGVSIGEGVHDVAQDSYHLGDGQLTLARELGSQRFARDERHHVVEQVIRRARGEELHNVGVLQRRRQLDLAPEPLDVHAGSEVGGEHFDDDPAAERALLGNEHAAHPAAAQLLVDAIGAPDRGLETRSQVVHERPR